MRCGCGEYRAYVMVHVVQVLFLAQLTCYE